MPRRRHTPEQVVRKLREADKLLNEGQDLAAVCRHLQVSEQTYHRWCNQYGGMKADDVKKLKELEKENQRLKRIVADKELEIDALREIARGLSPSQRRRAVRRLQDRQGLLAAPGVPDRRAAPLHPAPPPQPSRLPTETCGPSCAASGAAIRRWGYRQAHAGTAPQRSPAQPQEGPASLA
jgi:transposase